MFSFFFFRSHEFEFVSQLTNLYITGSGNLTNADVVQNCDSSAVTEIHVGEGCIEFEEMIFFDFQSLESLYLPSTLRTIAGVNTRFCYNLTNFFLPEGSPYFDLDEYGAIYTKGYNKIIRFPPKRTNFRFHPLTTIIESQAFQGSCLIEFNISNKITEIGIGFIYDAQMKKIIFEIGSPITRLIGFSMSYNLEYVFITKSIKEIWYSCFGSCINLKEIEFEANSELEIIYESAFRSTQLSQFIFPSNIKTIEKELFSSCFSLKYVKIPASLISINPQTFCGAPNIERIDIDSNNPNYEVISPSTLKSKDNTKVLYLTKTITDFTFQSSVNDFCVSMFQSCKSLTSLTFDNNNPSFSYNNGIIYSKDFSRALSCLGGISTASLVSNCQEIGPYCFFSIDKLTNLNINEGITIFRTKSFQYISIPTLTFPSTLQTIETITFEYAKINKITILGGGPSLIREAAFRRTDIYEMHLGSSLTTVINEAFAYSNLTVFSFDSNCPMTQMLYFTFACSYKLKSINIPKNVVVIDQMCFRNCTSLSSITFDSVSKLEKISTLAFRMAAITTLTLPPSLTVLGGNSFAFCPYLNNIVFPSGINLQNLGGGAFKNCSSLVSVEIPQSVSNFDASTFVFCNNLVEILVSPSNTHYISSDGIVYTIDYHTLVACPGGKVRATVRNDCFVLGSNSFYGCIKLLNLTFLSGCHVDTIEDMTFYSCTSLFRVDLPTSLRTVKRSAFYGCTHLSIITFPDFSVANLDADSIFADCSSLKTVLFGSFCSLTTLGSNIFYNCINLVTINIPSNCTNIKTNSFKNCVRLSNLTFDKNSKLKFLSGTSFVGCTSLTEYFIPDSFDDITPYVFGGASYIRRVNIMPNKIIKRISSDAFSSLDITSINFLSGSCVINIENYAFKNKNIESFSLHHSSQDIFIGKECFYCCTKLIYVSIPSNVYASSNIFKGCTKLITVNIPHLMSIVSGFPSKRSMRSNHIVDMFSIPYGVFDGCNTLETVTINGDIHTISDNAFKNCFKLKYIIPETVKHIGTSSFENCFLISNVPRRIEYFGNFSFYGTNIKNTLFISKNTTYIGSSSFINTPVNKVLYCGSYDFSSFLSAFNDNAHVFVSGNYVYHRFCEIFPHHSLTTSCNSIFETQDYYEYQKPIVQNVKNRNIVAFYIISDLGLW